MKNTPTTSAPAPRHPNMKGTEPRKRLAGGPFVDATTTLPQFVTWSASGVSQGEIIDRLTAFAVGNKYDPSAPDAEERLRAFEASPKVSPATPKSKRG